MLNLTLQEMLQDMGDSGMEDKKRRYQNDIGIKHEKLYQSQLYFNNT